MSDNICESCMQAYNDIQAYKIGYGDKYPPNVVDEIEKLRNELYNNKVNCKNEDCPADSLINKLDNDKDIKRKKGL